MELENKQYPHTQKYGVDTFDVEAGKYLRIETSPSGVEILNEQVPVGKVWNVSIVIDIHEIDA